MSIQLEKGHFHRFQRALVKSHGNWSKLKSAAYNRAPTTFTKENHPKISLPYISASFITVLKEDPDDLANLVSTANVGGCNMNGSLADSNIPSLDDSVPIFGEMFDELMLPSYGALLPDDINSLDSQSNKIDPFMSYRDESSETVGTPHILSPCLSKVWY